MSERKYRLSPRSVIDGETVLARNSPVDLALRNWWRILLFLTPAITGLLLFMEEIRRNPGSGSLTKMSLGDASMTAVELLAAAGLTWLTRETLSRRDDGLWLSGSPLPPWEKIGTVVRSGNFFGFCALGREGVVFAYVRIDDPEARRWLDGALLETGVKIRVQPAPRDYALQLLALAGAALIVFLGLWLQGAQGMQSSFVLTIVMVLSAGAVEGIDRLRGSSRVTRLIRADSDGAKGA